MNIFRNTVIPAKAGIQERETRNPQPVTRSTKVNPKPKKPLFTVFKAYIGAPYGLGGWSRETGFDCASLVCSVMRDLYGVAVPETFEGETRESYARLWQDNPALATRLLIRFAVSLGQSIPVHQAFAGDILVMTHGAESRAQSGHYAPCAMPYAFFLGIHAGNDTFMGVFEGRGVALARFEQAQIRKVIRCRYPQQS